MSGDEISWVRAEYEYDAEDDDELSFAEGDEFPIIRKDDENWWTGRNNGREGMFPSNYVVEIEGPSGGGGEEEEDEEDYEESTEVIGTATAEMEYASTKESELSFSVGDTINIISNNGNWWKGELNGKIGRFPSQYVFMNEIEEGEVEYNEEDYADVQSIEAAQNRALEMEQQGFVDPQVEEESAEPAEPEEAQPAEPEEAQPAEPEEAQPTEEELAELEAQKAIEKRAMERKAKAMRGGMAGGALFNPMAEMFGSRGAMVKKSPKKSGKKKKKKKKAAGRQPSTPTGTTPKKSPAVGVGGGAAPVAGMPIMIPIPVLKKGPVAGGKRPPSSRGKKKAKRKSVRKSTGAANAPEGGKAAPDRQTKARAQPTPAQPTSVKATPVQPTPVQSTPVQPKQPTAASPKVQPVAKKTQVAPKAETRQQDVASSPRSAAPSQAKKSPQVQQTPPEEEVVLELPEESKPKQLMKALYDYEGEEESELSFVAGDIIVVLEPDDSDGWWKGKIDERIGYFSRAFVEEYGGAAEEEEPKKVKKIVKKKVIQKKKVMKTRIEKTEKQSEDTLRAMYECDAEGDQELSFPVGALMKLLEKDASGWWKAEFNGEIGYIPEAYVVMDTIIEEKEVEYESEIEEEVEIEEEIEVDAEETEEEPVIDIFAALEGKTGPTLQSTKKPGASGRRRPSKRQAREVPKTPESILEEDKKESEKSRELLLKETERAEKAVLKKEAPKKKRQGTLPKKKSRPHTVAISKDDQDRLNTSIKKKKRVASHVHKKNAVPVGGGDKGDEILLQQVKKTVVKKVVKKATAKKPASIADAGTHPKVPPPTYDGKRKPFSVKALSDYSGKSANELDLRKGGAVTVHDISNSGWWLGEADKIFGWFPSTYVAVE